MSKSFRVNVVIEVVAGQGGYGKISFTKPKKSSKFKVADGGSGGNGGNVYIIADTKCESLIFPAKYKAENGISGSKNANKGKRGEDLILVVPANTLIYSLSGNLSSKKLLCHLCNDKESFMVAKGGKGGVGNIHTQDRSAHDGLPGESLTIYLERIIESEIAIVGLANSGKTSLLNMMCNSKYPVDSYAYTTLTPNLGCFKMRDVDDSGITKDLRVVDLPAPLSKGFKYYKYLKNTKLIFHVVDISSASFMEDVLEIKREISLHVADKQSCLVFSKGDLVDNLQDIENILKERFPNEKCASLPLLEERSANILLIELLLKNSFNN